MGQGVYSNDLRSRVVAEVAGGTSRRQAARLYRVTRRLRCAGPELHDETGSVSPRRRGLTLQELEQRLHAGLVLVTTERSIRRFFERHGISFKKTLRAAEQDRPTSPKRA